MLIPAQTLVEGDSATFRAVMQTQGEWKIIDQAKTGLQIKWELVKNDNYGNHISSTFLGKGPIITLRAPTNYDNYEVYLYVNNDKMVKIVTSKLNTPLVSK